MFLPPAPAPEAAVLDKYIAKDTHAAGSGGAVATMASQPDGEVEVAEPETQVPYCF